jgi:hypothetical protein
MPIPSEAGAVAEQAWCRQRGRRSSSRALEVVAAAGPAPLGATEAGLGAAVAPGSSASSWATPPPAEAWLPAAAERAVRLRRCFLSRLMEVAAVEASRLLGPREAPTRVPGEAVSVVSAAAAAVPGSEETSVREAAPAARALAEAAPATTEQRAVRAPRPAAQAAQAAQVAVVVAVASASRAAAALCSPLAAVAVVAMAVAVDRVAPAAVAVDRHSSVRALLRSTRRSMPRAPAR